MRTIIAGSRHFKDYNYFSILMKNIVFEKHIWFPTVILSGCCKGIDKMGERWAECNKLEVEKYPADWDKHGKKAGYIRNLEMAEKADTLIAFWDQKSKGTKMMIDLAIKYELIILVQKIQYFELDIVKRLRSTEPKQ